MVTARSPLAVFGATGLTVGLVVNNALACGHGSSPGRGANIINGLASASPFSFGRFSNSVAVPLRYRLPY